MRLTLIVPAAVVCLVSTAHADDLKFHCPICGSTSHGSHYHDTTPSPGGGRSEESKAYSRHVKAFNRANKLFGKQNFQEALAAYEEALAHAPGDEATLRMIERTRGILMRAAAQTEAEAGNFSAALQLLENSKAVDPRGLEYTLKNIEWVESLRDQAEDRTRAAAEVELSSWDREGDRLADEGKYAEAEIQYRKYLARRPSDAATTYNLANMLRMQGRTDEALATYREALRLDPRDAMARNNIAVIDWQQKRWEEAEAGFREALLIEPGKASSQKNLDAVRAQTEVGSPDWISKKQDAVRSAVDGDAAWRASVKASLEKLEVPAGDLRPKGLKDLKAGDVVLLAPADASSHLIAIAEQLYTGRVFGGALESEVSHALTFLGRDAAGRALFLDNTSGDGTHVIGQTEYEQKYGARDGYVARPQKPVDGRELLKIGVESSHRARKTALPGSDYGVFGKNDAVCSERAGFALSRATGQKIENGRLGPIDLTPGDFLDEESTGKYFLVSPFGK